MCTSSVFLPFSFLCLYIKNWGPRMCVSHKMYLKSCLLQLLNPWYMFPLPPGIYFLSTLVGGYISTCSSAFANGPEAPRSDFLCFKSSLLFYRTGPCVTLLAIWKNICWIEQVNFLITAPPLTCGDICIDFSTLQSTLTIIITASLSLLGICVFRFICLC